MKERRQLERFRMNVLSFVKNETQGPEVDRPIYMVAENISAGGVFLKTDSPMEPKTRVLVDFILVIGDCSAESKKRTALVQVGGEVVRKEKRGMAVKFDEKYSIRPFTCYHEA